MATYLQVSDEILEIVWGGGAADPETVVAEMARLRGLALQIEDPVWRQRALRQVELLPAKIAGPAADGSPRFREAEALVARAYGLTGPLPERLAELDRIAGLVDRAATAAPSADATAIRLMATTLGNLAQFWQVEAGRDAQL